MSYGAHIVLLALLSVGWRGHSQARTLSVFNPTQFVAALRDETILQVCRRRGRGCFCNNFGRDSLFDRVTH